MSTFEPEGAPAAPSLGGSVQTQSSPEDIALMQRVLTAASRNPNLIPTDFMAYVFDYIQTSPLEVPMTQIFGFQKYLDSQVSIQTGMIFPYVSDTAPSGFLICDGTAVSRTAYAALYAVIGDNYGAGDGSTTFNLPDLQGRVPVGLSEGGKSLVDTLGDNEGLTADKRSIDHHHGIQLHYTSSSGGSIEPQGVGNSGSNDLSWSSAGDTDNTNHPAYLVVSFMIKT